MVNEELEHPIDTVHVNHWYEHPGCKAWDRWVDDYGKGHQR